MIEMPPAVFDGVPTDELEELLQHLVVRRYPAGAIVIAEGETCLARCSSSSPARRTCSSPTSTASSTSSTG